MAAAEQHQLGGGLTQGISQGRAGQHAALQPQSTATLRAGVAMAEVDQAIPPLRVTQALERDVAAALFSREGVQGDASGAIQRAQPCDLLLEVEAFAGTDDQQQPRATPLGSPWPRRHTGRCRAHPPDRPLIQREMLPGQLLSQGQGMARLGLGPWRGGNLQPERQPRVVRQGLVQWRPAGLPPEAIEGGE